ncbi:MAG: ribbon-helix-helix domain-containing protein [Tagaea sp.]|nr:ribbon-helix-helix domain-containing protein [Azospirillum sp.]MCA3267348.1 ribbon-helix-helix domain-containing protein [Azospirillum sp.]MCZ8123858.1 ribbon-helix-helix domain-containing protein [Magnetospirillum sp.]
MKLVRPRRPGHVEPRYLPVGRRRCALRLEPAFWRALEDIARERQLDVEGLLQDIAPPRRGRYVAEDVRSAVLAHYWHPAAGLD